MSSGALPEQAQERGEEMNVLIGLLVAFCIGTGCRYFDIPVPSPPVFPGALLVVAMTLGYTTSDKLLRDTSRAATTKHLCGGPTGESVAKLPHAIKAAARIEERSKTRE